MRYDISPELWKIIEKQDRLSGILLDDLTVSEDGTSLNIEALTPQINPKTIKVNFKGGFLKISAEKIGN